MYITTMYCVVCVEHLTSKDMSTAYPFSVLIFLQNEKNGFFQALMHAD